jgi:hypothetical protein
MSTAKIRKGIPIPDAKRRGPPRKHPIDQLGVGDSVRLESSYNSVVICCNAFVNRYEPDWEFRIIPVDKETTDVWRIK